MSRDIIIDILLMLAVVVILGAVINYTEKQKIENYEEDTGQVYFRPDIDLATGRADVEEIEVETVEARNLVDQPFTDEEIELISHLVVAEAEGQPEEGQRYVVDVVLNRVESDIWPDTVREVIHSPGQFSCIWDGRWERCSSNPDVTWLVVDEILRQKNNEIVYFRAGHYGDGDPVFVCGDHYFSK